MPVIHQRNGISSLLPLLPLDGFQHGCEGGFGEVRTHVRMNRGKQVRPVAFLRIYRLGSGLRGGLRIGCATDRLQDCGMLTFELLAYLSANDFIQSSALERNLYEPS